MGSGQVGRGDDVEHPKGVFFREEKQEETDYKVQALAVADAGAVKGESAEHVAEGVQEWGFARGDGVGFEVDVIGECAMEIALDYFFVAVTELGGRARDEGGVEVRVLLEVSFSSSVEEPGGAAPGRGDAFAYVALCFRGAAWKLGGEVGREL